MGFSCVLVHSTPKMCSMSETLLKSIKAQEQKLSRAVGQGLSHAEIEKAANILKSANRHPDFIKYKEVPFIYEKLAGEEADAVVKEIVDLWTSNSENIQRAAKAVGRDPHLPGPDLVRAFCAFRFKSLKKKWKPLEDPLAVDQREHSTIVIIALEDLNHDNGCFVTLRCGDDVCLDGNEIFILPGNGEGLGIFIDLNF